MVSAIFRANMLYHIGVVTFSKAVLGVPMDLEQIYRISAHGSGEIEPRLTTGWRRADATAGKSLNQYVSAQVFVLVLGQKSNQSR